MHFFAIENGRKNDSVIHMPNPLYFTEAVQNKQQNAECSGALGLLGAGDMRAEPVDAICPSALFGSVVGVACSPASALDPSIGTPLCVPLFKTSFSLNFPPTCKGGSCCCPPASTEHVTGRHAGAS